MKKKNVTRDTYYATYYGESIDSNAVYLESRDGLDFTGNILRIAEELCVNEAYAHLHFFVRVRNDVLHKIHSLANRYHLDLSRMEFAPTEDEAINCMEKAKYIVTDSGAPWGYVKREGQVVLNTWHGTPLKVMGRYIPTEEHKIGTVQHLFLSSDYLLYPSYYMKDKMLKSYMVDKVATGKALMEGYPRNSVFFDAEKREQMREKLGFVGKRVYAYMPTHRGSSENSKNSSQLIDVVDYLSELDCYLNDDELLLVKLHVFNQSQINFVQFDHIVAFPEGYEPYDVLNATDCLITDYSSVMFDYANTGNNIILFTYDEEEYFEDRGTYFPLSELPFPSVKTIDELLGAMRTGKAYDDSEFLGKYCTFDNPEAVQKICRHVFLGQKCCKEEQIYNGKENVLLYAGSLAKNGITTAFVNLLNCLDKTEKNYFVTFRRQEIDADPSRLSVLPEDVDYLPLMCDQYYTTEERRDYDAFRKSDDPATPYPGSLARMFEREWDRYYWGVNFTHLIQFDGYGINVNLLFHASSSKKTIFVHNDMLREIREKGNQHEPTLKMVYGSFDNVAVVSDELIPIVAEISGRRDNIHVVNNIHDAVGVRLRAEQPIEYQKDTLLRSWTPGGLYDFCHSDGYRIVTIGRFSAEKGHERLIRAFDCFCDEHPDAKLLIIGGHGALYDRTVQMAASQRHYQNILILRSISNPMPILKQSDLFVLSSYYEGLPMVIQEADSIGLPIVSTDIKGPHDFMGQYGGCLVPNTEEGIYEGMKAFARGEVHPMHVNYEERNKLAFEQFLALCGGDR